MSETTNDAYKQRIEHAARALLLDEQICAVASQRMTLKVALLKVGFSQDDIDNNKHRTLWKEQKGDYHRRRFRLW